jgi:UDP:flavonoid glycosyltransferase YjiC (YdhE family)
VRKKKVLFVAEAVTLAHVARPLVLSSALDPRYFDIDFACDPRSQWLLAQLRGRYLPLRSIAPGDFMAALARGAPVYDKEVLASYVRDDLHLLAKTRPDVVVGDFRLSLSVSARVAGVPYLAISNCYWSPYWEPPRYTVPNLFLTRLLPVPVANVVFGGVRPIAFAVHSRPLNQVRRSYGLPTLGYDLRRVYTDGDHVLYADVPELFSPVGLPANHHFIGPLVWSPPVPDPHWWSTLREDRPLVYVTLGSSGQAELLPEILDSLAAIEVTVIAASAGTKLRGAVPANAFVESYLPGDRASRRAALVICNGGSSTSQQALAAGTAVIGIPSNLDQFLNMEALQRAGAGEMLRADRFSGQRLARLAKGMLRDSEYARAVQRLAEAASSWGNGARLAQIIEDVARGTHGYAEKTSRSVSAESQRTDR